MPNTSPNLFEEAFNIDPEKDYSLELVGEGKKFVDTKALARGKVEADRLISQQQAENKELREDLARRQTVAEAIAALQTTNNSSNSGNGGNSLDLSSGDSVALNEETINKLIRDTVSSAIETRSKEEIERSNLAVIKNQLEQNWGSDFSLKLKQVTTDLGVSETFLMNVAKSQPKAFLKLVGAEQKQNTTQQASMFSPSASGVNTAGLGRQMSSIPEQERYSYWQNLRKENPTLYHSPKSATSRFEAAKKHGEAFYAN